MRRINMHDLSFASAVIALMMSFLDFTSARTLKPPKITVAIRDHRVLEGGTVSFFCEASGVPTPTVMWKRNAMPIRPRASRNKMEIYKRTPHASALRIRKASAKKDNATFTCLATNIVGEASSSANLFVYPKRDDHPPGYPVIKATPGLLSLAINRPLLLDCDVKGDPKPRVTWLKNAFPVDVSNDPRIQILETGSLQILNSQESDQGTYECVAENKWGVAYSHRAMIYVRSRRVAPNFIEVPSDQKVDAGSDVNLTCKASGSPLPYVRWSQGANYITDDEKVPMDSAILTLTNIRQSTNYTCEASSNLGKIYHTVQVIVQKPVSAPQNVQVSSNSANTVVITWDPPSRLNGKILGYKVFYTTRADEPIFFWKTILMNGDNRVATITELETNVTYAISVLAFSTVGQGPLSKPIKVTTQGARRVAPFFIEVPSDQKVDAGSDVNLTCKASGSPLPYVRWSQGANYITDDEKVPMDSAILTLTNIRQSTNYTCEASSNLGKIYHTVQVIVQALKPPKITVAIRDHRVLEGGTVSFFCEASGVPTPTVMWKRNAMPIRPRASRNKMEIYKRTPHASALRIRKASAKKDNATFTCLATNIVGEASSSANLFVYPKRDDHPPGYPVIKATPGLLSLAINRPLLLDCDVKGDPKPRVTWLKNAFPVDVSNDPRIQILETGSLQILNSQESDQGTYECVAENKWGVAYSHRAMIYVRSRRVAPNFIEVPSDQKVDAGSDVNLTCKAFGSPLPYVRWSQGANYITDDEKVPMDSAILTLTNIRQSTNYTCEASSNLDKIYHTVQVIVQEPASAPQNVQVSSNSANTVVITWDPPSRLNGKILGYKVFYTNKADEPIFFWESHVVNGDNRVATISGLKANVTYAISVLAFSAVGQGPMSHPIQVLTTQGAHIKTEKPEFTDIGGGNILLKLKKASVKNGVISHYHIIVVPEKKSGVKRMPTINKSWYFLFPKTYKYGGAEATKYKVLKMENGILGPSFAGLLSKL